MLTLETSIGGMSRGFQHRLMWPYKVVLQKEDVENGRDTTDVPIPAAGEHGTISERISCEMLPRERTESTAVAAETSPSMAEDAAKGSFHEFRAPISMSDTQHRNLKQTKAAMVEMSLGNLK